MATAEQCQRFAQFIKTSTGQTVADPTGFIATYFDYAEWVSVAKQFVELTEANVAILFTAGGAISPEIGAQVEQVRNELDALPSFWSLEIGSDKMMSYSDAVKVAYTLAQKTACLLAEVEDRIAVAGGVSVTPWKGIAKPKPGDDSYLDEVVEGASTGIIVLVGLWLWSRRKK